MVGVETGMSGKSTRLLWSPHSGAPSASRSCSAGEKLGTGEKDRAGYSSKSDTEHGLIRGARLLGHVGGGVHGGVHA